MNRSTIGTVLSTTAVVICLVSVLISNIFSTTFSTANQAIPLLLSIVGFVISIVAYAVIQAPRNLSLLYVIITISAAYFTYRAYLSPVKMYFKQDFFILAQGFLIFSSLQLVSLKKKSVKLIIYFVLLLLTLNLIALIPAIDNYRDQEINYAMGEPWTGLFNHQNFFSNVLSLLTCFLFGFLFFKSLKTKQRLVLSIVVVISLVAVVISGSRGGALALVVGLITSWILHFITAPNGKKTYVNIIALSFLILGIVSASILFKARAESGSSERTEAFAMGVDQMFDEPLIGSGSRSYEYMSYYNWPVSLHASGTDLKFVHNEYLQAIDDYGLIGLLLFIMVMFAVVGVMIKSLLGASERAKQNKEGNGEELNYYIILGSISALLVMLTHSYVSFPFHGFVNVGVLAIILGIGIKQAQPSKVNKYFAHIIVIPLSCFIALLASVEFQTELKAKQIFNRYNIGGDDSNFYIEDVDRKLWSQALEKVVSVAPNFDRYNKLGSIYMYESSQAKSESSERELQLKAIHCYEQSQKLHPYNHISSVALGNLFQEIGQFDKAEKEYIAAVPYLQMREKHYGIYFDMARFYILWSQAEDVPDEKKVRLLEKASSALENHLKFVLSVETYSSMEIRSYILYSQAILYSKMSDSDKAIECANQLVAYQTNFNYRPESLLNLGEQLSQISESIWIKNRKPKKALELFKVSQICFERSSTLSGTNLTTIERYQKNKKTIEFFKTAGF